MALDRDELAARFAVADLSNPNFATDFTDAKEVARWAAGLKGLADALLAALVPVAPASGAPATEPRRTVGAVVTWASGKVKFIVVETGNGERVQRELDLPNEPCVYSDPTDAFVRWATREECERHGIPYVERGAAPSPAASPAPAVDREGLAKVLREAENGAAWCESRPWGSMGAGAKERYLKCADAAIAFLKANGGVA